MCFICVGVFWKVFGVVVLVFSGLVVNIKIVKKEEIILGQDPVFVCGDS